MALSPGAWAFFTGDSVALITLAGQQLFTTRRIKRAAESADTAATKADVAAANTKSLSNGFAGHVREDLTEIKRLVTLSLEENAQTRRDLSEHERKPHARMDTRR